MFRIDVYPKTEKAPQNVPSWHIRGAFSDLLRSSKIMDMFTQHQISQFQKLYFEHFGEQISEDKAVEEGGQLIKLIEIVFKNLDEHDYQHLKRINPIKDSKISKNIQIIN